MSSSKRSDGDSKTPPSEEEPSAERERQRRQRRLQLLIVALVTTVECLEVIWINMTDQQRQLLAMRVWAETESLCRALARRVGEAQLRVEARGGRPAYELSLFLSTLRDAAGRRYEALRYA